MTPLFSGQFVILIVYFSAIMIELAMYCWVGNEIILKSLQIGDACYMSKWYEFSPRTNKILFLIMERSKRPLTISAYKFSVLSMSAYLKIIQCSYSYFTVLRRVYMKD
uniref:Odorant receptor n=1 Tax=Anoplophora chinensis TaxID=217632 RepID=A0A2H4ZB75_ANOCN|nr:odorant receptor [Anoplophora chinensis]